ncbi:MAG: hypothetical protein QJR03_15305 [Sphaerobacter sp.]|nr:hypothetical protein [Sphaerobacter sp.]
MGLQVGELFASLTLKKSDFEAGLSAAKRALQDTEQHAKSSEGALSRLGAVARGLTFPASLVSGFTRNLAGIVAQSGLAVFGMKQLADAATGMVRGLFSGNVELENTKAQLLAFTKDGDQAAAILEQIRQEAAKTPFAFSEMAKATAGLLPAAKAAGVELMDLVKQAEILAAANPAEGLEGAAFALREAVSGDFTSIIERFNLPRQYINQLKEEGVPNLEIVRRAMLAMGYDADLVSNLANTAAGRWSTFIDTLTSLKDTAMQASFEILSDSLARLQGWLDGNQERLNAIAQTIGQRLAGALVTGVSLFGALLSLLSGPAAAAFSFVREAVSSVIDGFRHLEDESPVNTFEAIGEGLRDVWAALQAGAGLIDAFRKGGLSGLFAELPAVLSDLGRGLLNLGRPIAQALVDGISQALGAGVDLAGRLAAWLTDQFARIDWGQVGATLQRGLGAAVALLGQGVQAAVDLGGQLLSFLQAQLAAVDWSGVASTVWSGISAAVGTVAGVAGDLGTHLVTWVKANVASIDWSQVGQAILAGIGGALAELREIEAVNTLVEVLGRLIDVAGRLAPLAGGIAAAVAAFMLFGPIAGVVSAVTGAVSTLIAVVTGLAGAIALVGGPVSFIISLLNPLTLILAGVTAAVGLLAAAFIGNWFGMRDAVMGAVGAILGILGELWGNLSAQAGPLLTQLRALWEALVPAINALLPVLAALAAVIGGVLVAALGVVMGALGGLVGMLAGALPGAIQLATGLIQVLTGVIQTISAVVGGVVSVVGALLRGDFAGAWEAAKEMVRGAAGGIGTIVEGLKNTVIGLISGMIGGVTGLVSGFVESIIAYFRGLYHALVGGSIVPDMVNGIITWIGRLPGEVLGIIGGLVADVLGRMAGLAADMLGKGAELVANVASGMTSMLGSVTGAAQAIIAGITGAFSGAITWLWQAGRDVVQGLIDGIGSMVGAVAEKARSIGQTVISTITSFGHSPWPALIAAGRDAIQGLVDGISDKERDAVKAAAEVAQSVIEALKAGLDLAKEMATFRGDLSIPTLDALVDLARRTVTAMTGIARDFKDDLIRRAKDASDALKAAFGALSDAVAFARTVAERDVVLPGEALVSDIKFWSEHVVRSLGDSGAYLGEGLLAASRAFSEAMGSAFEAMGQAVGFARDVAAQAVILPSYALVSDIKFLAEHAVRSFGDSALYLGDGLMAAATTFADAMGAAFDAMGRAVDFARQVADGDVILPTRQLVSDLKFLAEHAVQSLGDSGVYLGERLLGAAQSFGGAMQTAFEALGAAVEFARDVASSRVAQPSRRLIDDLTQTARDVVAAMGTAAQELGPQLLEAAQQAGDGVIAAFDAIGASLQFVVDVANAMREGSIREVPHALVEMLAALAEAVTQAFVEATSRFSTEVLTAAENASGAVRGVLDVFSQAVDYVKAAAELEAEQDAPGAALSLTGALATLITGIVNAFVAASQRIQTEALAAATAFAEAIKPLIELVRPVIEASGAISEMSEITQDEMSVFTGNVDKIARTISNAASIADWGRSAAEQFAAAARATLASVQEGLAALANAANLAAALPKVNLPPAGAAAANVPHLADGGVVTRPTLAVLGEAESEAVLPLTGPGLQHLARALATAAVIHAPTLTRLQEAAPIRHAGGAAGTAGRRAGDAAGGAGGVTVQFLGHTEIVATDRREAERAAGDIGWGVRTALRRRGMAIA